MHIGSQGYKLSYTLAYQYSRDRRYSCKRSPPASTSGRSAVGSSAVRPCVEGRTLAACTGLAADLADAVLEP
jgi:hypothetical protein